MHSGCSRYPHARIITVLKKTFSHALFPNLHVSFERRNFVKETETRIRGMIGFFSSRWFYLQDKFYFIHFSRVCVAKCKVDIARF